MRINNETKQFIRDNISTRAMSAQTKYRAKLQSLNVSAAEKNRLCSKCEKLYAEYVRATAKAFEDAGVEFVCPDVAEQMSSYNAPNIIERKYLVKKADIEKARDLLDRLDKTERVYLIINEVITKLSLGGDMKTLEKLLSEVKF